MKIYFTFSKSYIKVLCLFLLAAFSFLSVASGNIPKTTLENEKQRAMFLEQYGFCVDDPVSVKAVTVPLLFNDDYEKFYNALKVGGYDIDSFKGRKLTEYTYYAENSNLIHLLMDDKILVGADCVNLDNGSIHPLAGE